MNHAEDGMTEFGHELEPGYKKTFYAVFGIAVLYLVIIMGISL